MISMGSGCSSNMAARLSRRSVSAVFSSRFTSTACSWKPLSMVRRQRIARSIAWAEEMMTSDMARHADVGSLMWYTTSRSAAASM